MDYDLKLATGCVVVWDGTDHGDAISRYQIAHPTQIVRAWKVHRESEVTVWGGAPIWEPGDRQWSERPS